ncbi:MAG: class A beta-lactamase [Janthinobacterium lividum]
MKVIEQSRGGRLGVFALDTGTGRTLEHRADERFLLQSTFKGFLAAMVLSRADAGRDDLGDFIFFSKKDLVPASPVTSAQVAAGRMTIEDLCNAILERSDNTAANLLLKHIGGPASLTSYVQSLGDTVTRFDRYEPVGGWSGIKDTTTPRAIVNLARTVVLGDVLKSESRALLDRGMAANVVGRLRLRASFPPSWTAGDRTGTSDGICNDYAVAWPPGRAPLVMSAYYEAPGMEMEAQEAILREIGSAIVAWA